MEDEVTMEDKVKKGDVIEFILYLEIFFVLLLAGISIDNHEEKQTQQIKQLHKSIDSLSYVCDSLKSQKPETK